MLLTNCPAALHDWLLSLLCKYSHKYFKDSTESVPFAKKKKSATSLVELIPTKFRVKHSVLILTVAELKAW